MMDKTILEETTTKSLSGELTFPEVVMKLMSAGVESYRVDLYQNMKTFYMPNGEFYSESFDFQGPIIGTDYSKVMLISALEDIQNKRIDYREFLKRIMLAGIASYHAYLNGRKVVYMSRNGEFHVEHFPQ
ncbi:MAG: hypothetical protein KDD48_00425 [Bdellovibrionales bacterium]|nr:hypothetical protein [Bdellovibrionales bacterium]